MPLQQMLDIIAKESQNKGLSLNSRNTSVMVIIKKKCIPKYNVMVNGSSLKQSTCSSIWAS